MCKSTLGELQLEFLKLESYLSGHLKTAVVFQKKVSFISKGPPLVLREIPVKQMEGSME